MRRLRRQYLTGIALWASWREWPVDSRSIRLEEEGVANGRSTRRNLLSIRPGAIPRPGCPPCGHVRRPGDRAGRGTLDGERGERRERGDTGRPAWAHAGIA